MELNKQIKEYRISKKLTQKNLGELLNVSDKTISSWETGRTYPDIQLIVKMSDIFDISLDELLKGDRQVVEKIAEDTKDKKRLTKRVRLLWGGIIILLLLGLYFGYRQVNYQDITAMRQIKSITKQQGNIIVETNLPFYRSVNSYMMGSSASNPGDLELTLGTTIDWSFKNKQIIEIPIDSEQFPHPKKLDILGKNKRIKSIVIE